MENLTNAKNEGLLGSNEIRSDFFRCNVECRVVDQLGKQHDIGQEKARCELQRASYLKLINVPSMFDINGTLSDPTDGCLNLSMID